MTQSGESIVSNQSYCTFWGASIKIHFLNFRGSNFLPNVQSNHQKTRQLCDHNQQIDNDKNDDRKLITLIGFGYFKRDSILDTF